MKGGRERGGLCAIVGFLVAAAMLGPTARGRFWSSCLFFLWGEEGEGERGTGGRWCQSRRRRDEVRKTGCRRSRFFVPALGGGRRRWARRLRQSRLALSVRSRAACPSLQSIGFLWSRPRRVLAGGRGCGWSEVRERSVLRSTVRHKTRRLGRHSDGGRRTRVAAAGRRRGDASRRRSRSATLGVRKQPGSALLSATGGRTRAAKRTERRGRL